MKGNIEIPFKNVPLKDLVNQRYLSGLTYQKIATKYHVTPQAVHQKLLRFTSILDNPPEIEVFKNLRADIFSGIQHQIISSINSDDFKKAPLQSKIVSLGILYDKERLERGLSTERIDHVVLSAKLSDLQVQRKHLESLLVGKQGVNHRDTMDCEPSDSMSNKHNQAGDVSD